MAAPLDTFDSSSPYYLACSKKQLSKQLKDFRKNDNILYRYGNVTFEKYSQHYRPADIKEKIFIPIELVCATVLSIALIFSRVLNSPFYKRPLKKEVKIISLIAIRCSQSVAGKTMKLFRERRGSYLFEEGQFQLKCCLEMEYQELKGKGYEYNKFLEYLHHDTNKIPLSELNGTLVKTHQLEGHVVSFRNNFGVDLFQFIRNTNPEYIQHLTVAELVLPKNYSILKFFVMSDSELSSLTAFNLPAKHPLGKGQSTCLYIRDRLLDLYNASPEKYRVEQFSDNLPLIHYFALDADLVSKNIDKIPARAFCFLTSAQMKNVPFEQIAPKEIFYFLLNHETNENLQADLSTDSQDRIHKLLLNNTITLTKLISRAEESIKNKLEQRKSILIN